ncbi:metallophosphoesterase family protein [Rhizobium leguminosarum]|uniref:Uncharacterized protein n=1 Tax=Rhizobium leguminosarum TaxID=384 RepID=A0A2K9ZG17_RHILE|nr:metallophosphoesterase [Rhizobium leguminosarum]AUW47197.1 hypothetical protein CUJ84_pRLN3000059 [Rhizobium leguminosarum]
MAAPAIALRFRDTTVGIDTIRSHASILEAEGAVWWGWWKKDFENNHADFLKSAKRQLDVLIIDRSTRRMYRATAIDRLVGSDQLPELSLVPNYYRQSAHQIYGWFKLISLEKAETYDDSIGSKFGDGTFIVVDESLSVRPSAPVAGPKSERSSILHLSDLHFGPDYNFLRPNEKPSIGDPKKSLTDCVFEDLRRVGLQDDIESILVTGDFTSNGDWTDAMMGSIVTELTGLASRLGVELKNLLALPGNHDVVRYPAGNNIDIRNIAVENQAAFEHERNFRYFLSELLNRNVKEPLNYHKRLKLKEADVIIGLLNSCRILATEWTEYGYVGPSGLDVLQQMADEVPERETYRVMALHHHLLPVSEVEAPSKKGVTLSLDASELLDAAQFAGVNIALHGHQHMPKLARYQSIPLMGAEQKSPIVVVSNGSAGVSAARRPGGERNTYCVMTFTKEDVLLRMRELRSDGKPGSELYAGPVGTTPESPC